MNNPFKLKDLSSSTNPNISCCFQMEVLACSRNYSNSILRTEKTHFQELKVASFLPRDNFLSFLPRDNFLVFFASRQIFVSPWPLVFFLRRTRSVPAPVLSRRWSVCTIFRPASLFLWENFILSHRNMIWWYSTFFKADLIGCWERFGSLAGTVVTTLVGTWVGLGLIGLKMSFVANFHEYFRSN